MDKSRAYTMEAEFADIDLVLPREMQRFISAEGSTFVPLPPFHHQFTLHRIEHFRKMHKLPVPPHRKPVYDFIFLTRGQSVRRRNMHSFEIAPNSFFFLPAYQILTSEDMSLDIAGFYCHFDLSIFDHSLIKKDFINEFAFLHPNQNPIVTIPETMQEDVLLILHRLETLYRGCKVANFSLISTYLLSLFLEITKFYDSDFIKTTDAASQITKQYKEVLSTYIYKYSRVTEFADHLSVTPNYLNRCVNLATGRTASDLLFEMVLLEAKVLLKQTSFSISEIAYKLGRKDPSAFSRFFKQRTSMTPKQYRDT